MPWPKEKNWEYIRTYWEVLHGSWKQHALKHRLNGLTNKLIKTNKTCRVLLASQVLLRTPTHGLTSICQPTKAYIHQLFMDIDVISKTYQEGSKIEIDTERGSMEYMMSAWLMIYIIIMSRHQHGSPWPSPATLLYRLSLPSRLHPVSTQSCCI